MVKNPQPYWNWYVCFFKFNIRSWFLFIQVLRVRECCKCYSNIWGLCYCIKLFCIPVANCGYWYNTSLHIILLKKRSDFLHTSYEIIWTIILLKSLYSFSKYLQTLINSLSLIIKYCLVFCNFSALYCMYYVEIVWKCNRNRSIVNLAWYKKICFYWNTDTTNQAILAGNYLTPT